MTVKSSPELLQFYKDWNQWRLDGAPNNHNLYSRFGGLCYCLNKYFNCKEYDIFKILKFRSELTNQFREAKLNMTFPFGQSDYDKDYATCKMHLNSKRIAWVEARIAEAEEG